MLNNAYVELYICIFVCHGPVTFIIKKQVWLYFGIHNLLVSTHISPKNNHLSCTLILEYKKKLNCLLVIFELIMHLPLNCFVQVWCMCCTSLVYVLYKFGVRVVQVLVYVLYKFWCTCCTSLVYVLYKFWCMCCLSYCGWYMYVQSTTHHN